MMKRHTNIDRLTQHPSLEKGFALAYFISQDRAIAFEILIRALDKLSVQCRREKRRFYWRYNHGSQSFRRITHQEADAFQWLIMFESEPSERAQEEGGGRSPRDMVVRYIKHLVQITRSMSSFYVCVGINRLLYSYSTSETQATFELVTGRFPGADQYRRAKKMLTSQLSERFGELVETVRMGHGEIRFKSLDDPSRWYGLVHECLSMFSPWSTEGCCERLMAEADVMPLSDATAIERVGTGPDERETVRCHMFIEPVCRRNVSAALSFPPPEAKLAIPKFAVKEETPRGNCSGSQRPRGARLSEVEERLLGARLAAFQERRRKIRPESVDIVVDGLECYRMGLRRSGAIQIELLEGATLIEIVGSDETGPLVLGTHMISYADLACKLSHVVQPLRNGQLVLVVSPLPDGGGVTPLLTLTFERRSQLSWSPSVRPWCFELLYLPF